MTVIAMTLMMRMTMMGSMAVVGMMCPMSVIRFVLREGFGREQGGGNEAA